ncbi:MAG: HAMP domain-containing sensor histidine kinase [Parvularculaceae bacterium]|nr:HAMP domain-containing histidine kinase [Parvularculaceae bacterium]
MSLSASIDVLRRRLIDFLGGGAAFGGVGAASVALIRPDGRLITLSAPAMRMFADAEKAGTLDALFLPDDRAAVEKAVRSKAIGRIEARARRPGGIIGNFEILLERRPDGRAVALLIDRTAEKRDNRRLVQEIDRVRAEAADGAATLADLSHEMRTPLNAVIGFAETIERQTFGPVGHENYSQYAEHIRMAGRHLLDLVNTVLDLSKIDADRYSLTRVAVDPALIARECAAIMTHQAEEAGLTLTVDIAADLPECALDPKAVRQILLNLLSNAVKFTPEGDVRLTVRRDDDAILFTVKDDGVGMSSETLSKIGARFTAAHGSGVRGQGGAGLGLSLAISLAELHGGRVDLSSAPGEGLAACVRLPIVASNEPAKGAVRAILAAARSEPETGDAAPETGAAMTQHDRIMAFRKARLRVDAA